MSPPANIQRLHTPRTAATVLGEIREALDDFSAAVLDFIEGTDTEDRVNEADQRIDSLREEFNARVQSALGLSVEDIRTAYQEALL